MKSLKIVFFAGSIAGLAVPSFAEFSYYDTVYDTDWTSVGIGGMRGIGTNDLNLSGISGTVTGAYLFWHGPTNSTDSAANSSVTFNGNAISGTNIGVSQDNNWGYSNSQAYRANVTSLVSGDGTFTLEDFLKPSVEINGASLYVTYDDGDDTNNRDLVLFNGNDSNIGSAFDPEGWDVALNGINYTSGMGNIQLTVSDGQSFAGGDEAIYLNGSVLVPAASTWSGDLGANVVGNGSLWDEKSWDITSYLSVGTNNLLLRTFGAQSDALSLVVAAIDLPAGAAPPEPPMGAVPEPSTYGLMGAAALLGIVAWRRRNSRKAAATAAATSA